MFGGHGDSNSGKSPRICAGFAKLELTFKFLVEGLVINMANNNDWNSGEHFVESGLVEQVEGSLAVVRLRTYLRIVDEDNIERVLLHVFE